MMFINARIAAGLTHGQLVERLGVTEQQVQRWETTRYAGAYLQRIQAVAGALPSIKRPRLRRDTAVTPGYLSAHRKPLPRSRALPPPPPREQGKHASPFCLLHLLRIHQ